LRRERAKKDGILEKAIILRIILRIKGFRKC